MKRPMKQPAGPAATGPASESSPPPSVEALTTGRDAITARHLVFGWWSLLFFLALGIALETFHGLKLGFYLNPSQSTRRLMWTLAHAHGTVFALVNLGFAYTSQHMWGWTGRSRATASGLFIAGSVVMPAGFFLGGLRVYAGDPGLGIFLVPVGAVFMLMAVLLTALAVSRFRKGS